MKDEFKKILVCPKCSKVIFDANMVHYHKEDGINYKCLCCDSFCVAGLLIIGFEATDQCLNILDEEF